MFNKYRFNGLFHVVIDGTGLYSTRVNLGEKAIAKVYNKGEEMLSKDTKAELIKVLYADADYDKVTRPLSVGMTMTTASLAKCFSKTQSKLSLPKLP